MLTICAAGSTEWPKRLFPLIIYFREREREPSRREHIPGHFPSRFDRLDSLVRAEYLLTIFKSKVAPSVLCK